VPATPSGTRSPECAAHKRWSAELLVCGSL
jgi:hypothetical protein